MKGPTARFALLACLVAVLPACTVTLREPVIQPLNTNRYFDAELEPTCDAVESVITQTGLEIKESRRESNACLVESNFKVLSDTGDDPVNHLKRIAFTGPGGFIGGRYTVTVTTRDVRDAGTRVKVVTRVEGYINEEFGYQVLRSRGLLEESMFAAVGENLGTAPSEGR